MTRCRRFGGGFSGLVLAWASVASCNTTPPRAWTVRFAPGDPGLERDASLPGVEDDWAHIGLRVVLGSVCPALPPRGESFVPGPDERGFGDERVDHGERPSISMPNLLPDGPHSVMAWAVDSTDALYAWSCVPITAPGTGAIVSELRSVANPVSLRGEWRVSFADPAAAMRADRVLVRAQPGACPASAPTRLPSDRVITIPTGAAHVEPLARATAEPTAFIAWAENDASCAVVAFGCTDGPGPPVLETVLRAPGAPSPVCSDPRSCRRTTAGLSCDHLVIEEMAVGHTSACFRTSTGEVYCDGSIAGRLAMPAGFVPRSIVGRHARRSLVSAMDRADGYCALSADHRLVCWGDAFPFLDAPAPAPALVDPGTLPDAPHLPIAVALGLRFGCVVTGTDTSGGSTFCRGIAGDPLHDDVVGATGGTPGEWLANESTPFPPGRQIAMLASGAMQTCVSDLGRVWCWGDGRAGTATGDLSLQLNGSPPRYTQVSVGEMHACARGDDGLLQCWGSDFSGQLAPRFDPSTDRPAACAGLSYTQMLAREECAAWALADAPTYDEAHGTPGLGTSYEDAFPGAAGFPASVAPGRCPSSIPDREPSQACVVSIERTPFHAEDVSLGAFHTCAVSADDATLTPEDHVGRVLCWGNDGAQEVGGVGPGFNFFTHGTAAFVRPCDSAGEISRDAYLENVVDVEAGTTRTCARDSAGDVFCWGASDAPESTAICASRPASLPLTIP